MYFWHMLDIKWQCWVIYSILAKQKNTEVSVQGGKVAKSEFLTRTQGFWVELNLR